MNGNKFKRLNKGAEIVMDGKTYQVLATDGMGRVQMQQIGYYVDDRKVRDEVFDSFDDCMDLLQDMRTNDVDYDLTSSDIVETTCGNKFWVHYKDIEDDDIIYSYEK